MQIIKKIFSVQCDDLVNQNMSITGEVPSVQYLLGLDRRGTYVVRESVEKVNKNSYEVKSGVLFQSINQVFLELCQADFFRH